MNTELRKRLEEVQVSMAARGSLDGYLSPHLWEELRQKLQRLYRQATGEQTATINVEL